MRSGMAVAGLVVLIIGVLMMALLWPLIGFETEDTLEEEDIKSGGTLRYVGEITEVLEFGGIYVLELDHGTVQAYTKEKNFDIDENVLVTIKFGRNTTNWDENEYDVQKVPALGGYIGLFIFLLGLSFMIVGITTKKKTLEDVMNFSSQPPSQQPKSFPYPQPPTPGAPPPITPTEIQGSKVEQIKCPKCNWVFEVEELPNQIKISCPKCGLKGVIDKL